MFIQLTVVLSLFIRVCAQSPYDTSFGKVVPIITEGAVSQYIAADMFSNGDLLAAGWTQGIVGYPTSGDSDFFFQRYDSDGTLLWTKVFKSGTGDDVLHAAKFGSGESIYAVGYTFSGAFDGHPLYDREDASFAKFDSAGNKIFTGMFGGDQIDRAYGFAVDEARGVIYMVGYTSSSLLNKVPPIGAYDGFLVKVDSTTGAILSTKRFGVAGSNTVFSDAVLDSTGALWVCGVTNAGKYFAQTGAGDSDIILQKLSPSGESLFVTLLGKHADDTADYLTVDPADNLYTAGYTLSGHYNGETGLGSSDILITKHTNAGVKLWARTYGGSSWDVSTGISVNSEHNRIYVTGNTQSRVFAGVFSPVGSGFAGYAGTPFLLVLDATTGAHLFAQVYPTGSPRSSGGGIVSRGSNTYMTGHTVGAMFDQANAGTAAFVLGLTGDQALPTSVPTNTVVSDAVVSHENPHHSTLFYPVLSFFFFFFFFLFIAFLAHRGKARLL